MLGLVMPVWPARSLGGREEGLGDRRDAASSSVGRHVCSRLCVVGCGLGSITVSYFRRLRNVNYRLLLCEVVSEPACDCCLEKVLSLMPLYRGRREIFKSLSASLKMTQEASRKHCYDFCILSHSGMSLGFVHSATKYPLCSWMPADS